MTDDGVPPKPSVLNTTVLSNFAYIDELWVVADLSGICTVPVVREELENGVGSHPYLQVALDTLGVALDQRRRNLAIVFSSRRHV